MTEDAGDLGSALSWGLEGRVASLPPSPCQLSPQTGRKEAGGGAATLRALTLCSPVWAGWGKGSTWGGGESLTCTWHPRRGEL